LSELRYNLITRDWVIIASERAKRPEDFKKSRPPRPDLPKRRDDCPFCPGNEKTGGEETYRLGSDSAWRVRSIYNKFPALSHLASCDRFTEGPEKHMTGFGIHEVLIEHPDHNTCMALMDPSAVEDIFRAYRDRYIYIRRNDEIKSIIIFKNHGPAAGSSQEHPHSQIVATPVVPHIMRSRIEGMAEHYDVTGKCMMCGMLEHELKDKKRIVLETEHFVSHVPYAAAAPFVTSIVPRRHSSSFDEISDAELKDLAGSVRQTLSKLYYGLDNPDFNYTIRSVPVREKWNEAAHWFISVMPRLTQPAGFELGSGMFINVAIPEESAAFLRQVICK
jgi:UDPglucose--hexose-1-phosphate uridylyltransferase